MPPCAVSKNNADVVRVVERLWRRQSQRYLRLLPARLGVISRGRSRRLERVLTDFGAEHSFARAVGSIAEHYGFAIEVSAVRDAPPVPGGLKTLAQTRRGGRSASRNTVKEWADA